MSGSPKPFNRWNDEPVVTRLSPNADIDRDVFEKVLRDLTRLSPQAHRLDVEAAVWRSVTCHTRALTADEVAEGTWRILRRLARPAKDAA